MLCYRNRGPSLPSASRVAGLGCKQIATPCLSVRRKKWSTVPVRASDDGWGNEVEEIQKKVSKMGKSDEEKIDAAAGAIADVTSPLLTNLGFSGAMGLSVAIALKTLGAVVATVVGFGFILVQLGAYFGILDVNWSKLGDVATQALDVTGDGKVGKEDVQLLANKFIGFASFGLPSVGGFITGLLLGLKVF